MPSPKDAAERATEKLALVRAAGTRPSNETAAAIIRAEYRPLVEALRTIASGFPRDGFTTFEAACSDFERLARAALAAEGGKP